jgi:hypothetical protein
MCGFAGKFLSDLKARSVDWLLPGPSLGRSLCTSKNIGGISIGYQIRD